MENDDFNEGETILLEEDTDNKRIFGKIYQLILDL